MFDMDKLCDQLDNDVDPSKFEYWDPRYREVVKHRDMAPTVSEIRADKSLLKTIKDQGRGHSREHEGYIFRSGQMLSTGSFKAFGVRV